MMKRLVLIPLALLSACAPHPNDIPPPTKQTVITKEVPVPVLCQVTVTRPVLAIDGLDPNAPLEDQDAGLRATIAQQATFIIDLINGLVGCGGTVK